MATIFAPRSFRARTAWVITLTWVATALVPQMTIQSDFSISRGSAPISAPGPGDIARPGDPDADRAVEARIALGVGQALDPVAHHEAHRAGVEIGPDAFGPEPPLGLEKGLRDAVERFVPADRRELSRALGPDPHERFRQPVGVVDPLAVAGDFRADDPRGVGLVRRAADASDPRSRRSPRRRARRPKGSRAGRRTACGRSRPERSCGSPEAAARAFSA